ncbi:unnamed protein product, partial [Ectocarpus sp. 12 AP-2014]
SRGTRDHHFANQKPSACTRNDSAHIPSRVTAHVSMATFLLLDATDQAITLCWERGPGVSVEEVQMKTRLTADQQRQQQQEVKDGSEVGNEVAQSSGSGGDGLDDEGDWVTLSKSLGSSALRKKKLAPGTEYVFRRRARKQEDEEWGPWSKTSEPFRTLSEGIMQPSAPAIKLREAGALVMEWPAVPSASGYEIQMSTSGSEWYTLTASFGSTLLRKKGLEGYKQYRFRLRPVFGGVTQEGGGEWGWSPSSDLASPA